MQSNVVSVQSTDVSLFPDMPRPVRGEATAKGGNPC